MANELIYKSDARRAILKADPSLAYVIDEVKAVDAVEVVHGRWKGAGMGDYYCSVCQTMGSPQWKCCPVCTARMDGGNEDG
jgi:hypothetical protein